MQRVATTSLSNNAGNFRVSQRSLLQDLLLNVPDFPCLGSFPGVLSHWRAKAANRWPGYEEAYSYCPYFAYRRLHASCTSLPSHNNFSATQCFKFDKAIDGLCVRCCPLELPHYNTYRRLLEWICSLTTTEVRAYRWRQSIFLQWEEMFREVCVAG